MTETKQFDSIVNRYEAIKKVNASRELQIATMQVCAHDITTFVNHWVWTYDPREMAASIPFDLFPKQAEFLDWLAEREIKQEDGLAEKCRDVGFTWLCCAYAVHGWLYRPGYRVGFGSRKLELVDTIGDPKCIFEKIRFIIDNLPYWMKPKDFSMGWCKILNGDNGSSISGEGGDNIGRGDRSSIYFVDEAAFLERSERVDAALSQTSRSKIWVSTPNGQGNAFYRKRFSGVFPVFTFNWRDDPRKGQEWYDKQKATLDPVTLAQEVDIDYSASIEGICIPAKWVRSAVDLYLKHDLPQSGPVISALDIAGEGVDKNVQGFRQGVVMKDGDIESWGGVNTTYTANKARDTCVLRNAAELRYDIGGGYGEPVANQSRQPDLKMKYRPMDGGDSPSDALWNDGQSSKDKFINARAEWWWLMRERFRKVYEFVEDGVPHPFDEMISIPNNPTLISELSMPMVEHTETGKIRIESKKSMKKRGVKSPDHADMLAYLYANDLPVTEVAYSRTSRRIS